MVGGPAVNRLTAQAMGLNYPTTGADSGVPEGADFIRMVENAFGGSITALVVKVGTQKIQEQQLLYYKTTDHTLTN